MKVRVFVAAAALLASTIPAGAQEESYRIYGYGARKCTDFITEIKGNSERAIGYFSWAQGYMSRRNSEEKRKSGRDVDLAPDSFKYEQQFEAMFGFCTVNGSSPFVSAVETVFERLRAIDALAS